MAANSAKPTPMRVAKPPVIAQPERLDIGDQPCGAVTVTSAVGTEVSV